MGGVEEEEEWGLEDPGSKGGHEAPRDAGASDGPQGNDQAVVLREGAGDQDPEEDSDAEEILQELRKAGDLPVKSEVILEKMVARASGQPEEEDDL